MVPHGTSLGVTAETLHLGTTIRYHYRNGSALATVVERTPERVTFVGDDCDGTFTHDQIDRLFATDRLQVVLDDELHLPDGTSLER
ncbi:hypothetical protein QA600_00230 [Natronococcus sp. A-GB1]|uniref:Uncharacterized protein n=1 Tax=Natronococcus amylolyticus DSM 10524 TaxID=1227497 RepID=L9XDT0_9EURY|nr:MULTISPECIES: hypothetical protein [Natronococcus]ELY59880.1 hypothetical protein C491_05911 [Natronococcus amylolyticus DSM 10524]MDG5757770.1 hypothetical protein [Natronococcus sp. A-GB1]